MTENEIKRISIAKDFSQFPIGRDDNDSPFNGEKFRKAILVPAFKRYQTLIVNLDGPKGYGSSFLEEAFGGLVRLEGFKAVELQNRLKFEYNDQINKLYADEAWEYITDA